MGYSLASDPLYIIVVIPQSYQDKDHDQLPVLGDFGYYLYAYSLCFNHLTTYQPIEAVFLSPRQLDTMQQYK